MTQTNHLDIILTVATPSFAPIHDDPQGREGKYGIQYHALQEVICNNVTWDSDQHHPTL